MTPPPLAQSSRASSSGIQAAMPRRAVLTGAAALSLAACSQPLPRLPFAREAANGAVRLPRVQAVLDAFVETRRLPGATVGVRLPDGSMAGAQSGQLAFDAPAPMTPDSLFRIYSMTKPITGTAAALLIEDGRLRLDQPVSDFIPEFARLTVAVDPAESLDARPARQVMTIRHLLTHTSGLTYHFAGNGPVQQAYRRAGIFPFIGTLADSPEDGPRVRSLESMARRLSEIPLLAEPGAAYNYGVSLDVLGLVIQRASGLSLHGFLQRRLFDPLGMNDTVWRLRPGDESRLAALYVFGRGGAAATPVQAPTATAAELSAPVTLHAGGAGLISTTRDYLAFLSMLVGDGRLGRMAVMRPDTARLIRSDILPEGLTAVDGGYGFGGWVARPGHRRQGEFGWSGAASTQGWIDPEKNFAAVMMIQAMPYGAVGLIDRVRAAVDADLNITRTAA